MKFTLPAAVILLLIIGIALLRTRRVSDPQAEQDFNSASATLVSVDQNPGRVVGRTNLAIQGAAKQQVKIAIDAAGIVIESSALDRLSETVRLRLAVLNLDPSQIDSLGRIMAIEEQLRDGHLQLSKSQIDAIDTGVKADIGNETFRIASLGLSEQHWNFVETAIREGMSPERTLDLLKLHGDIDREWESKALIQNPTITLGYANKLIEILGPDAAKVLWKRSVVHPVFLNSLGAPD